jgi:hypothetical protein
MDHPFPNNCPQYAGIYHAISGQAQQLGYLELEFFLLVHSSYQFIFTGQYLLKIVTKSPFANG